MKDYQIKHLDLMCTGRECGCCFVLLLRIAYTSVTENCAVAILMFSSCSTCNTLMTERGLETVCVVIEQVLGEDVNQKGLQTFWCVGLPRESLFSNKCIFPLSHLPLQPNFTWYKLEEYVVHINLHVFIICFYPLDK